MVNTSFFLPETLIKQSIWVLWRLEERDGHMTKVPYQTNGKRASSTGSSTWSTYHAVRETLSKHPGSYNGIGTVLSKELHLVFIDIDHCIDESGNFDERAKDILDAFTDDDGNLMTFVEVSQSGSGLHLVVLGNVPRSFNNRRVGVEMYDTGRFIAMTGRAFSAREPCACEEGITYVFERYKTAKNANHGITQIRIDPALRKGDDWIIEHASEYVCKFTTNKFPALFGGDISGYESKSEADLALCKIIAFWANNDASAIDRVFRRSALYRAKWEREDYRNCTIARAIKDNNDTVSDYVRRKMYEMGRAADELLTTMPEGWGSKPPKRN